MKISVCMAVYNGAEYIEEQIGSILPQLKENDELIISDDGSTDNTLDLINDLKDKRVIIYQSNGGNIVRNFENALGMASGDVIFLADQDDIWYSNKVKRILDSIINHDLVFSNASVFSANLNNTKLLYSPDTKRTGILRNMIKNNYIGATMAFNRKVLDKALPFPKNIYMHDAWLGALAEIIGKTHYIDQPLIYYRRHGNNASETGEKSSNSLATKVKMRLTLGFCLLSRLL